MAHPTYSELLPFLSTPSARRATATLPLVATARKISIHALREEGDTANRAMERMDGAFLSTPSARRATDGFVRKISLSVISIHALREEGDIPPCVTSVPHQKISIHALREEGDMWENRAEKGEQKFLSTPSARRATRHGKPPGQIPKYFYPRPPRGGRPPFLILLTRNIIISIHALREEGDFLLCALLVGQCVFLSTPSARRATRRVTDTGGGVGKFLSTPSARRATLPPVEGLNDIRDFYPRPPRGGRLLDDDPSAYKEIFLSTPSARRATPSTRCCGPC